MKAGRWTAARRPGGTDRGLGGIRDGKQLDVKRAGMHGWTLIKNMQEGNGYRAGRQGTQRGQAGGDRKKAGMHGISWISGGGTGIDQAGRTIRGDRRVGTGRGQAGKTVKENRWGLDKKWAGRQD